MLWYKYMCTCTWRITVGVDVGVDDGIKPLVQVLASTQVGIVSRLPAWPKMNSGNTANPACQHASPRFPAPAFKCYRYFHTHPHQSLLTFSVKHRCRVQATCVHVG